MAPKYVEITGIPVKAGQPIPSRLECDAWSGDPTNEIQVSLFIRALQIFYAKPYLKDKLSYFQVAGIHGLPTASWDGVEPAGSLKKSESASGWGYCAHAKSTFPTWHRPYMLLFEQCINKYMHEAIKGLANNSMFVFDGEETEWHQEADKWRLPYWDWGLHKSAIGLPKLYTTDTLVLRAPKDNSGNVLYDDPVDNPLKGFHVKDDNGNPTTFDARGIKRTRWSTTKATSRHGYKVDQNGTWSGEDGVNNVDATNTALRNVEWDAWDGNKWVKKTGTPISDIVYRLYSPNHFSSWEAFATTGLENFVDWKDMYSIEQIHNTLHTFIGGNDRAKGMGHMSDPTVAAFDPVFYMHHCNIDRQFAIFQSLPWNAKIWMSKDGGELAPFHMGGDKPWTSHDTRYWWGLGYDYDILVPGSDGRRSGAIYYGELSRKLDGYYNTGIAVQQAKKSLLFSRAPEQPAPALNGDAGEQQVLQTEQAQPDTAATSESTPAENTVYPDYILSVIYDRYALEGQGYSIHFFLGNVDVAAASSEHASHIGQVDTFSNPLMEFCDNCRMQADEGKLSSANVPITMPLLTDAGNEAIEAIQSIDPHSVESYLAHNLSWKIMQDGGSIIDPEQVPRTRVFALKGSAKHFPEADRLSEYFDYTPMPTATEGKPLGASAEQYNDPLGGLQGE